MYQYLGTAELAAPNGARFVCAYTETTGVYGTVQVDNNLRATHTQATADANHQFTIEQATLKVTVPSNNGTDYMLDGAYLKVNAGFTGTISADVRFNAPPERTICFDYDHNGLRTRKTVTENGVTTTYDYTLHGKLITHLTKRTVDENGNAGTEELHFFYDVQGNPAFVKWNNAMYRYVHNLQGDIVGIIDAAGNLVVEYRYDAWGKPISTTGSKADTLGKFNPFRYRSYIYDSETEFYWLKERYYAPQSGKFLNADSVFAETGALGSSNCYAYCRNSPIILEDDSGKWPSFSKVLRGIAVVAAAVAVVAVTVATCGAAAPVLAGIGIAEATAVTTSAAIVAGAALVTSAAATTAAVVTEAYENQPREYTVYCLADPVTKEVQYVGRTKSFERRMQAHRAPYSRTNGLIPTVRIDNLTYVEARGLEEVGMAYYHTRKYLNEGGRNLIRAISPRNKNASIYRDAASQRCSYLYNRISNRYLCWLEEM